MQRRFFVAQSATLVAAMAAAPSARADDGDDEDFNDFGRSAVILWNQALIAAIAATKTQATIAARACSMVHEAIYNAWAAYDRQAAFTLSQMVKRPFWEGWDGVKTIAISHAAYTVLVDLFPAQKSGFDAVLGSAIPNELQWQGVANTARQVGQLAGNVLLQARHQDGSNQLGDMAAGAYADYTGYVSINTPDLIRDPTRWQPLRYVNSDGLLVTQKFLTPHWGRVRPFALSSGSQFRPLMQHLAPTQAEMIQLVSFSAGLDDYTKSLVDFFAQNPGNASPPGQWMGFAEQVSARDNNGLDDDVKLFFATAQALHDAGIACWDSKRVYDSVRPITALPYYFRGQMVRAWAGSGLGVRTILADNWRPFQRPTFPTPGFPEFCSGHSTFSAAAAAVMAGLRCSDNVTITGGIAAKSLKVDVGFPTVAVNFTWNTLTDVANAAGLSRRLGGIHFEQGDLSGRALGRQVGAKVLARCQGLFAGRRD